MSSIVYLKMSNGDDIIATLISETLLDIDVTNPLAMKTIHDNGSSMSGFFPWAPLYQFMNSIYKINKHNIIANVVVPLDVQKHYSGIVDLVHLEAETDDDEEEVKEMALDLFVSANNKATLH